MAHATPALGGNVDLPPPYSDPSDITTDGASSIAQWQLPSTAGYPTEPNIAISGGLLTFTGWALGAGVYNTFGNLLAWCPPDNFLTNPILGVGNYCYGDGIVGSDTGKWWNVGPSGSEFLDARTVYDYHDARWIYTSFGVNGNSNLAIAVSGSSNPSASAAVWHQYSIPNGCPSGQATDFPKVGINANWLLVIHNCSASGFIHEGVLHVVELPSVVSGGPLKDHILACPPSGNGGSGCSTRLPNWTTGMRPQNHDTPVTDESGQDHVGYTVAFRGPNALDAPPPGFTNPTTNVYAIGVCTITGPVNTPVYNTGSYYWGSRGSLSGSGFDAREDVWANGHEVITAAAGMAYGENSLTAACGSEFTTQKWRLQRLDDNLLRLGCDDPSPGTSWPGGERRFVRRRQWKQRTSISTS